MKYVTCASGIAIITLFILSYKKKHINEERSKKRLDLSGKDAEVVDKWMKSNVGKSFETIFDPEIVAAKLLKSFTDKVVDPELIVIGEDLKKIYGKVAHQHIIDSTINIYSLRDNLGIPGEIAVFNNRQKRDDFKKNVEYFDATDLNNILYSKQELAFAEGISNLLKIRWTQLRSCCDTLINNGGSFAYLTEDLKESLNVKSIIFESEYRINMLCDHITWDEFIKRMSK